MRQLDVEPVCVSISGERLSRLLAEREREFDAEFETKFGDLNTLANPEGRHCADFSIQSI